MDADTAADILVVEDSPTQAKQLDIFLREQGFGVTVAANGRIGLAEARRLGPDLIISDINMPEMNGFELCKMVKGDPALNGIPVILLTTMTDPTDIIGALNVSADCYVSKPYDEKHLLSKISLLIEGPSVNKIDRMEEGLEIDFAGKHFVVTSTRAQILTFLISIYEDVMMKNRELARANEALEVFAEKLNEKVVELRASEDRYQSLVSTIPDIVYRLDTDGNFVFINKAIRKLGFTPKELIGTHFSRLILPSDTGRGNSTSVLPPVAGRVTGDTNAPRLFEERAGEGRETVGLEVRLAPKHGATLEPLTFEISYDNAVTVDIDGSVAHDGIMTDKTDKMILGTVGVARDITDRKRMEAELKKSYEELETKVQERTADLRNVNESLREQIAERERVEKALQKTLYDLKQSQSALIETEKIVALGTLTAGVAHELNNPMMGMLNLTEYCMKKTAPEDKRYEVLQDVERETRRCIQIVQNLLTFSRIKKEREEEFSKERCGAILDRVLRLLSYRIDKEGITVTTDVAEDTPEIMMRVSNIQQVFVNVVGNAMDAMKESLKKEIAVHIMRDGGFVRIEVSDTGCGISPEKLPNIFDPFFTTKPVGQGTGLGLSISKSIMKSHGGEITCTIRPGTGTTFCIMLPITVSGQEEDGNEKTHSSH